MKVMMPYSAELTTLIVADLLKWGMPQGTGISPMEVGFPVQEVSQVSSEAEVRWWYICSTEEVELKGSTTVRYLMQ